MFDAIFAALTEGAPLEGVGASEGSHSSFRDPGVEGGLEVDDPDAGGHTFFLKKGKSSPESFGSVPKMNWHVPSFETIPNFEVDILGNFRRAFLSLRNACISF